MASSPAARSASDAAADVASTPPKDPARAPVWSRVLARFGPLFSANCAKRRTCVELDDPAPLERRTHVPLTHTHTQPRPRPPWPADAGAHADCDPLMWRSSTLAL